MATSELKKRKKKSRTSFTKAVFKSVLNIQSACFELRKYEYSRVSANYLLNFLLKSPFLNKVGRKTLKWFVSIQINNLNYKFSRKVKH